MLMGCFWVINPSSLWGTPGAVVVLCEFLVPDVARDSVGAVFGLGSRSVLVGSAASQRFSGGTR